MDRTLHVPPSAEAAGERRKTASRAQRARLHTGEDMKIQSFSKTRVFPKSGFLLAAAGFFCGVSPPSCGPPQSAGPPCHTRDSVQKLKERAAPVHGVKEAFYKGVVSYPDPHPDKWWIGGGPITKEPCDFTVKRENGSYIINTSIFPHPLIIIAPMDPQSDFYIAQPEQSPNDVFILQQVRSREERTASHRTASHRTASRRTTSHRTAEAVSLAKSGYNDKGELIYGLCGREKKVDLTRPECLLLSE